MWALVPELVLSVVPDMPAARSQSCNRLPPEQWPLMPL
jgi:hypothetical protein